jgi:hypothetical protein
MRTASLLIERFRIILPSIMFSILLFGLTGCDRHRSFNPSVKLPLTHVSLSPAAPIVPITSWHICGPFVMADSNQQYSKRSEAIALETDYLRSIHGQETPLRMPTNQTRVPITLERDVYNEPDSHTATGAFLNQNQDFRRADVSSQILFWDAYHVFKVLYAATEISSAEPRDLFLVAATNSPVKIWVNDQVQTQSFSGSVGADWYSHTVIRIHFKSGRNTILVKIFCFPKRNDFAVWLATIQGAQQFIKVHGGVFDLLTQVLIPEDGDLHITQTMNLFDEANSTQSGVFIRDILGHTVTEDRRYSKSDIQHSTKGIVPGLYSIIVRKAHYSASEIFFVGNVSSTIASYVTKCNAAPPPSSLPCDALPALADLAMSEDASFRLDKEKIILLLISQFEWAIHGISPQTNVPEFAPRVHLLSFQSAVDGTRQYYYLHVPSNLRGNASFPLVVVEPYNTSRLPFFEGQPTTSPGSLLKYANFSDQYGVAFMTPFTRGLQLPSPLAERDSEEALQDAEQRFNSDRASIYLAGECAGGRSALLLAENHPKEYAAISVIGAATGMTNQSVSPQRDAANALLHIQNIAGIPIRLVEGKSDMHAPIKEAMLLMNQASKWGIMPDLVVLPGNGLFETVEPTDAMFAFFGQLKPTQRQKIRALLDKAR